MNRPTPPKLDVAKMVSSTPLFTGLKKAQVGAIVKSGKEMSFEQGQTMIREGEQGVGFFLVLKGEVEVRLRGKKLAALGPGQFFGEMALLDERPRSADVVATKPTICYGLTPWSFMSLIKTEPEIGIIIMKELARRLRGTNKTMTE